MFSLYKLLKEAAMNYQKEKTVENLMWIGDIINMFTQDNYVPINRAKLIKKNKLAKYTK